MNSWVTKGAEPPASSYPRIARKEAVPLGEVRFPKIPGVAFPTRIHTPFALDFGPQFRSEGIVAVEPPRVGRPYPVLLPQVDVDGNEIAGVRMPWITVPLATFTGWNLRDPALGAPEELFSFAGSTIPFAKTKAERERTGDPRLSIAERYRGRDDYLQKIRASARSLAAGGYLLEGDIDAIVRQAGPHWDHWTK
jgi:hypothetical protein